MLTDDGKSLSPIVHGIAMILSQTLYNGFFALPYTVVLVMFMKQFSSYDSFLSTLGNPAANLMLFVAIGVYMCLAQVSMVALEAVASRALGAVSPGVISRWSLAYIRIWLKTALVSSVDMWLSGSRNYPVWLRAAGMKVGRRSEIGSIMDVVPELVHVNNVSFFADGIYLGGPRIQKGTVTLANTTIENNVFLGNHVVVPAGQRLPEDLLIGVSTVADDRIMRAGSSWFGNPPFDLINREVIIADRSLTSEPSLIRIFNRSFWDWMRFTLPFVPTMISMFWFSGVIYAKAIMPVWALVLFGIPAVSLACGASLPLVVLGLKWGLLGRVKDGQHALYSCWTSRWDFLSVASEFIATRPMASFEGTLLLNVYLRLMGVKIGKRVLLADGYSHFVDHDMIEIGDYATVGAMYQAHTFEDRMLKIGHIKLGNYSTLGNNTVPLYLSDVGEHTFVAPASVIMKGEVLPSWTSWDGNPARQCDEIEIPSKMITEESSKHEGSVPLKKGELLPRVALIMNEAKK
jgi:non-ribosomal peptide synthetase-like protein